MSIRAILLLALVAQQLPAPFHTPWFRKATRVVAMPDGHQLTVPAGFTVNLFADELQFARFMALAPNGDVFSRGTVQRRRQDHRAARRRQGRRGRDARDVRDGTQSAVRARVSILVSDDGGNRVWRVSYGTKYASARRPSLKDCGDFAVRKTHLSQPEVSAPRTSAVTPAQESWRAERTMHVGR